MSRWFRHYAGMMRDDKLVSAAIKAKQPVERVTWVWGAILESASEINDAGIYRLDCAEVAYFLRTDEADIRAIIDALGEAGRVASNRVVKWSDRQFKSDQSAERQAKYRDKKRSGVRHDDDQPPNSDAVVTEVSRHGDAPEAETDTENRKTAQQVRAARPKIPDLEKLLFDAAGVGGFRDERHPRLRDLSPVYGLIDAGYDLHRDILPVVEERSRNKTFSSWRFFEDAVIDTASKNRAIPQKAQEPAEDWSARVAAWRTDPANWIHAWGPKPDEPGCKAPTELLRRAA